MKRVMILKGFLPPPPRLLGISRAATDVASLGVSSDDEPLVTEAKRVPTEAGRKKSQRLLPSAKELPSRRKCSSLTEEERDILFPSYFMSLVAFNPSAVKWENYTVEQLKQAATDAKVLDSQVWPLCTSDPVACRNCGKLGREMVGARGV